MEQQRPCRRAASHASTRFETSRLRLVKANVIGALERYARRRNRETAPFVYAMQLDEARQLLGFPYDSNPTPSQVKAAYKRKAWESHPDRFPAGEKSQAESKFKSISEAYSCLGAGNLRHPKRFI